MKRLVFVLILMILSSVLVQAQSNVDIFFVACETQAVLDLTGAMAAGRDVYYQVFNGAGGTGTALSALRRVSVGGDYAVSQVIPYTGGTKIGFGLPASVYVAIASESDSSRILFETTVDDFNDGCAEPSYATVDSDQADTPDGAPQPGELISHSGIFTPDGGFLNPVYASGQTATSTAIVVIGARGTRASEEAGRTANPGLIFAECDAFPLANPGVIYDIDTIRVFWSWFAATPQLLRDHIAAAQYSITLNNQPLPNVQVSPIVQRDGNYWVFYTANLGDKWQPGNYGISFKLEWSRPISDGYENYGPGTENPVIAGGCAFSVKQNPYGIVVVPENPKIPLQGY
jgi:hypothetical protein